MLYTLCSGLFSPILMARSKNTTCKFKFTLDPNILIELDQAFPCKNGRNAVLLQKYVSNLQDFIVEAISKGIYPNYGKKHFALSLEDCTNASPQINRKGLDKMRFGKLLEKINRPLFNVVKKGTKFSREISRVVFPPYAGAVYQSTGYFLNKFRTPEDTRQFIQEKISDFSIADEYHWKNNDPTVLFHSSPINSKSLINYALSIRNQSLISEYEKNINFDTAVRLICYAHHGNGVIDYKIKVIEKSTDKDFGRVYYEGLNIQNLSKEVRAAMLGNSYEYDAVSSVISWKMSELTRLSKLNSAKPAIALINACPYTKLYLEDKAKFQSIVKQNVFSDSSLTDDEKTKLVKRIFTAMCFGADLKSNYWYDQGTIKYGSIRSIIVDEDLYNKFATCPEVIGFYKEQKNISKLILKDAKEKNLFDINNKDFLRTKRNYFSNNKCMAFLYQHNETIFMDQLRLELAKFGITPIANIHDAIILRKKLTKRQRQVAIDNVRAITDHPYFNIGEKKINAVK